MAQQRTIVKIGLAVMINNRLLLVRKRGGKSFILPGGKPEIGENDHQAILREIDEELGCGVDLNSVVFLGAFKDVAADLKDTVVEVRLYAANLVGSPSPHSEIECLTWVTSDPSEQITLAPSIQNQILPFLRSTGKLAYAS